MIYRVLGVLSLAIGGIFGIVTLLVLLPFLDNFNLSLLILAGVFAILAYVFLAIGLQLFHPPQARGRSARMNDESVETVASNVSAASGVGAAPAASGPVQEGGAQPSELIPKVEAGSASVPSVSASEDAPGLVSPAPAVVEPVDAPAQTGSDSADALAEAGHEPDGSSNGGAPIGHPATARTVFKKPGAAVPRD